MAFSGIFPFVIRFVLLIHEELLEDILFKIYKKLYYF